MNLALSASIEEWTDDRVDAAHHLSTPGTKRARSIVAKALRDAPNEPIVVSGPTGYGKSLLLKVLCEHPPGPYVPRLLPFAHIEPDNLTSYVVSWLNGSTPHGSGHLAAALAGILGPDPDNERRTLLLLDEIQATPAESLTRLLDLCEEHNTAFVGAGLSGSALESLLSAQPRSLRRIDFAEPWDKREASRYLGRLAAESGVTLQQLTSRFDLASLLETTAGNPRLVRTAIAARLRVPDDAPIDSRRAAPADAIGPPAIPADPTAVAEDDGFVRTKGIGTIDPVAAVTASVPIPPVGPITDPEDIPDEAHYQPPNRISANDPDQHVLRRTWGRQSLSDAASRTLLVAAGRLTRLRLAGRCSALGCAERTEAAARRLAAVLETAGAAGLQGVHSFLQRTASKTRSGFEALLDRTERTATQFRRSTGQARAALDRSAATVRGRTRARAQRGVRVMSTAGARGTRKLDAWRRVTTARARQSVQSMRLHAASWCRRLKPAFEWEWLAAACILVAAVWVATEPNLFPNQRPSGPELAAIEPAVSLAPVAAPPAAAAAIVGVGETHLRINALPWALVELDGNPIGSTPVSVAVAPGRHHVQVEMSDGRILEKTIFVSESEEGEHIAFQ